MKLLRRVRELEPFPVGYGPAWPEPNRQAWVCAPLPFNILLNLGWRLLVRLRIARDSAPLLEMYRLGREHERDAHRCRDERESVYAELLTELDRQSAERRLRERALAHR